MSIERGWPNEVFRTCSKENAKSWRLDSRRPDQV